jgi:tRNA(adenine34) deaminase
LPHVADFPDAAISDDAFMKLALAEADRAFAEDEVPIGAVIVAFDESRGEARLLASAHNRCEAHGDPTAHAELVAIRTACAAVGAVRLDRATLYSTIEPCAMCAGAILHARIERVVFGAHDPKFGAAGSVVDLLSGADPKVGKFNHRVALTAGMLAEASRDLMQRFFQRKRAEAKANALEVALPSPTIE